MRKNRTFRFFHPSVMNLPPSGPAARTYTKPWLQRLKEAEARRPDLPGEHVVVLGLGLLMLVAAGRSRSLGGRLLKSAIGGALVGRAASGTGGVARLAQHVDRVTGLLTQTRR